MVGVPTTTAPPIRVRVAPLATLAPEISPPDDTVVAPLSVPPDMISAPPFDTVIPETTAPVLTRSVTPLATVALLRVKPELRTSVAPADSVVAPARDAPPNSVRVPPLFTIVSLVIPLESTRNWTPLEGRRTRRARGPGAGGSRPTGRRPPRRPACCSPAAGAARGRAR